MWTAEITKLENSKDMFAVEYTCSNGKDSLSYRFEYHGTISDEAIKNTIADTLNRLNSYETITIGLGEIDVTEKIRAVEAVENEAVEVLEP